MPLTILGVGYGLAAVGEDAVGGAEQILTTLDRELIGSGHNSIVVAPSGSIVCGTLISCGDIPASVTADARVSVRVHQRFAISRALTEYDVDVIHCHGVDFAEHLPDAVVPTLVTLHLPFEFYPADSFSMSRPGTWFNCVSSRQRQNFPALSSMLPEIENGVPVGRLQARHVRRNFALCLGRICPEKGFEHALDAARIAGIPLLIGGTVHPYEAHQRYFATAIRARLGAGAHFLGPLGWARKRRLLNAAHCLLVPSLAPETSSLVAMEAAACGTPVVAFPSGALADIVEHGVTGYLVEDFRQMADAIAEVPAIDRERCRRVAYRRFCEARMVARYFALYRQLSRHSSTDGAA